MRRIEFERHPASRGSVRHQAWLPAFLLLLWMAALALAMSIPVDTSDLGNLVG